MKPCASRLGPTTSGPSPWPSLTALASERERRSTFYLKQARATASLPPTGKLADAALHFGAGPLDGLKLIGFSVWERRTGAGRNVTFPARQYSVNGECRSFALLWPIGDAAAQDVIREAILNAYAEAEAAAQ